eukprot:417812-Prymnesium_polylepis.2
MRSNRQRDTGTCVCKPTCTGTLRLATQRLATFECAAPATITFALLCGARGESDLVLLPSPAVSHFPFKRAVLLLSRQKVLQPWGTTVNA